MKNVFYILAVVVTMAACKTQVKQTDDIGRNMVLVDTTGLSANNTLTDVGNNQYIVTPKAVAPVQKPAARKSTAKRVNNSNTAYASKNNTTTNAVYPQKDKGWSSAAKGTAIGGGAGAVLGAVIAKNNRVGGGIIGAVLGAGAGYAIGRANDRKTGRVDRTRAWKASQNGY
ncbi:MAG TPA: glycine zipper 2TM domain-containing protein [Ferruginibacter sp.]|nr:glycine zipper 2TM domain-containing protein [Ferruginibacter sp.]